ncbi:MAG: cardiolipin synthase [Bacteroidales bacterium]|nr:cardiolipin synthase [Bacteroidales bacterium]
MRDLILIFLTVVLVSVIIVLISQNRHPVKTLAWILLLALLPGVGLVLYFLLGTDHRRRRLISVSDFDTLKQHSSDLYPEHTREADDTPRPDLVNLLRMTNGSIPLSGNDLRIYTDFDSMYSALLSDLESAVDHIHFEFFKFEDDPVGRRVGELLIAKARAGVEVRVQYDHAANYFRGKFYRWLREGGVEIMPFMKIDLPFLATDSNYRNHRKIVVVDGRVGYCGGMNIAERYSTGIRSGIWRDTHFRAEGPVVSEMQTAFLADWKFSSKQLLAGARYYPKVPSCGDVLMQVATSGPLDEWNVTMQAMIGIISQARSYVWIESPYLIPTESLMLSLRNAALSGIDVRLIIPYRGDRGVIVPLATRSNVEEALVAGVKVFFYEAGYMHSKTIVSDDSVVTIGSTNLDVRSFKLDFEINGFIYDPRAAAVMKEAFLKDQAGSRQVDLEQWRSRPWGERFMESVARLFSPIL